ncbi:hypothetical protein EDD22DRAFT_435385 [Suillus occidentalis]|nr:hypothetical protein EDD22DRAFT_435385 [Suillus occidentalis]
MSLPHFTEAASDLGLFENNQEGFLTLQEAVDCLRTPSQLRFLFAQIILEGYPASILWDEFKDQLSIDHTLHEGDQQNGYRCTLHKIDEHSLTGRKTARKLQASPFLTNTPQNWSMKIDS